MRAGRTDSCFRARNCATDCRWFDSERRLRRPKWGTWKVKVEPCKMSGSLRFGSLYEHGIFYMHNTIQEAPGWWSAWKRETACSRGGRDEARQVVVGAASPRRSAGPFCCGAQKALSSVETERHRADRGAKWGLSKRPATHTSYRILPPCLQCWCLPAPGHSFRARTRSSAEGANFPFTGLHHNLNGMQKCGMKQLASRRGGSMSPADDQRRSPRLRWSAHPSSVWIDRRHWRKHDSTGRTG